jgi:sulfur carrier protein ThiS
MRMHRGSSKDGRDFTRTSGILPLSAPSGPMLTVTIEITRGASIQRRRLRVPPGTLVRTVLRSAELAPEGSAVLVGETPIPLDTPLERPVRLIVVPTFSGG